MSAKDDEPRRKDCFGREGYIEILHHRSAQRINGNRGDHQQCTDAAKRPLGGGEVRVAVAESEPAQQSAEQYGDESAAGEDHVAEDRQNRREAAEQRDLREEPQRGIGRSLRQLTAGDAAEKKPGQHQDPQCGVAAGNSRQCAVKRRNAASGDVEDHPRFKDVAQRVEDQRQHHEGQAAPVEPL